MPEKPKNAFQAALERAAAETMPEEVSRPEPARASRTVAARPETPPSRRRRAPDPAKQRSDRKGTRLIAAHFPEEVADDLKLLAVQERTTLQALMEEAVELLRTKKARKTLRSREMV